MITNKGFKRLLKAQQEPLELYHVTYNGNLPSIAQGGLQAAYGEGIGGAGYAEHKKEGIFLTEKEGITFWFDLAERWSQDRADNPYEAELTPVVLQVEVPDPTKLSLDELGTQDSNAQAWIYPESIPAENIYYWDPGIDSDEEDAAGWYAVTDYEEYPLDASHAYDVEEEDGEELYYFKEVSPFKPTN